MEIDIEIDGLTNCLVERATGQEKDTQYRLISKTITKAEAENLKIAGWLFDWSIPHSNGYEVYELLLKDTNERQGLIALKHIRNQLYTHVDVVESSPSNRGSHGIYQGVGAHLFAIACKLSWDDATTQYFFNVGERVFHEKLGIGHIADVIGVHADE